MSTSKFTSGPWGFLVSESGAISIFNSGGIWIATTLRKQWPQEDRANADLIAAAPELYEALDEAMDLVPRVSEDDPMAPALAEWCAKARAALAKAMQP